MVHNNIVSFIEFLDRNAIYPRDNFNTHKTTVSLNTCRELPRNPIVHIMRVNVFLQRRVLRNTTGKNRHSNACHPWTRQHALISNISGQPKDIRDKTRSFIQKGGRKLGLGHVRSKRSMASPGGTVDLTASLVLTDIRFISQNEASNPNLRYAQASGSGLRRYAQASLRTGTHKYQKQE